MSEVQTIKQKKGKKKEKNKKRKKTKTLYMALHRPREPTHCTSLGGQGQAKDGKQ